MRGTDAKRYELGCNRLAGPGACYQYMQGTPLQACGRGGSACTAPFFFLAGVNCLFDAVTEAACRAQRRALDFC